MKHYALASSALASLIIACTSGSGDETNKNDGENERDPSDPIEMDDTPTGTGSTSGTGTGGSDAPVNMPATGGFSATGGTNPSGPPECGNGFKEDGEACDTLDLGGQDCVGIGFTEGGELRCNSFCQFDSRACLSGPGDGGLVTEVRTFCSDTCWKPEYIDDGKCYDGGPHSNFNSCEFGTDCTDCGSQELEVPIISGGGRAACGTAPYGVNEGDPAENWTTYNQHGAPVSLSDFCGKWVYIELGRMGCPVCRNHAPELEAMAKELKDFEDGLVVVDALGANLNPIDPNPTDTPSVAELQEWAGEFGQVEVHAVCDAGYAIHARYWPFGPGHEHERALDWGHPRGMLINPDGVIEHLGQASKGWIKSKMEAWH